MYICAYICYWKGQKRLKCCWCLVSFGFLSASFFAELIYSFPLSQNLHMYYFAKLACLGINFFSLKAQSFQHFGMLNFPKLLLICVPFSQLEMEPGFDKRFYTVSMRCCGSSNIKTDLNAMVKFAVPFLSGSACLLLVATTPKNSMLLFLINRFLEMH